MFHFVTGTHSDFKGTLYIPADKITAFHYKPDADQTVVYVGGGSPYDRFFVDGDITDDIINKIIDTHDYRR